MSHLLSGHHRGALIALVPILHKRMKSIAHVTYYTAGDKASIFMTA